MLKTTIERTRHPVTLNLTKAAPETEPRIETRFRGRGATAATVASGSVASEATWSAVSSVPAPGPPTPPPPVHQHDRCLLPLATLQRRTASVAVRWGPRSFVGPTCQRVGIGSTYHASILGHRGGREARPDRQLNWQRIASCACQLCHALCPPRTGIFTPFATGDLPD